MPARRPYASRGVPRRATTLRSGAAASANGLAAVFVVLAATAAGVIFLGDLWPREAQTATSPSSSAMSIGGIADAVVPPVAASGVLQMADVTALTPTPATNAAGTLLPTSTVTPTLRRWDAQAP